MRYVAPTRAAHAFNALTKWLTARGISLMGSRVLAVRGRKSGNVHTTVVNLFTYEGHQYLLAPRGHTQWVRNVRVAGEAELRVGRRVERVRLVEVPATDRVPVLRVYLKRWGWEVGRFVEGLSKRSTDAELATAAPGMPVFALEPLAATNVAA